nr:hypothetical protein [Salmonella sp.]
MHSPCDRVQGFTNNNNQCYPQAEGTHNSQPAIGAAGQGIGIKLRVKFRYGLHLDE